MTEPRMRVLLPVADGNEDIEFTALFDVLVRAGLEVTVASVENHSPVRLMQGMLVIPDTALEEVADGTWDAIAMPGGIPGAMNLARSETLRHLIRRHHAGGQLIAAICLSPALVLEPAGVLAGCTRVTGNPLPIRTRDREWPADEFTKLLGEKFDPDARVCVDQAQRIITSQTPGTAIEFALAIVDMLCGPERARQISEYFLVRA